MTLKWLKNEFSHILVMFPWIWLTTISSVLKIFFWTDLPLNFCKLKFSHNINILTIVFHCEKYILMYPMSICFFSKWLFSTLRIPLWITFFNSSCVNRKCVSLLKQSAVTTEFHCDLEVQFKKKKIKNNTNTMMKQELGVCDFTSKVLWQIGFPVPIFSQCRYIIPVKYEDSITNKTHIVALLLISSGAKQQHRLKSIKISFCALVIFKVWQHWC